MASGPTRSVTIIVQHSQMHNGWSYRLIAYDDTCDYTPVEFNAIGDLVQVIRRVVPDFSESRLIVCANPDASYIAFSADLELNTGQLFLLGLNLKIVE